MSLSYLLLEKAIGLRAGLGSGRELSRFQIRRHLRNPQNWLLPGALGAAMIIGNFSLLVWTGEFGSYMIARILVMDYVVFAIGWLVALMATLRWRRDETLLQNMILACVRPASIAHMILAGPLSLWAAVLFMVAVAEYIMVCLSPLEKNPRDITHIIVAAPLFLLTVNWFHLQSIRIAHWMFLIVSLRQVPLRQRAIRNLFLMVAFVTMLTFVGFFITLFLTMAIISAHSWGSDIYFVSFIAIVCFSLGITGLGKVYICRLYEAAFIRTFLCFVWYGAAEKVHPAIYPPHFSAPLARWKKYLREEEIHSSDASPWEQAEPDIPSTTLR